MRLTATPVADWAGLAWVATCSADGVELLHGPGVEAREEWAFEGTWDGSWAEGAFDEAAIVAGSGVRIRGDRAIFVPPTSTVDRLAWLQAADGSFVVSNSLAALLGVTHATVTASRYRQTAMSISKGLERGSKRVRTSAGPARLHFFHNLVWNGRRMRATAKPPPSSPITDFGSYREFLAGGFAALASNMGDPARARSLSFLGTASSGFDANASAALAAEAGCAEALCFETTGRGHDDSGVPVLEQLGIEPIVLQRDSWRSAGGDLPEADFLAVGQGSGLLEFHAARERLADRVLVTGFYGDSIWNPDWPHLGSGIVRKDASGLAFTEYRLRAGFVNCPPAFWAARDVGSIVGLANSEEMAPWHLGTDYERPIPRRLLEEAGVRRDGFGRVKRGVPKAQPHRDAELLSPPSRSAYFAWLRLRGVDRIPAPLVRPSFDRLQVFVRELALRSHVTLGRLPGFAGSVRWARRGKRLRKRRRSPTALRRPLVEWALETASRRYER